MTVSHLNPSVQDALRSLTDEIKAAESASSSGDHTHLIEHCMTVTDELNRMIIMEIHGAESESHRWTKAYERTIQSLHEYGEDAEKGFLLGAQASRAIMFTKILMQLGEELLAEPPAREDR